MSIKISAKYVGNKRVKLVHDDSGTEIITAAPVDNNGDGSSFSPTDLFSSSLGACMLTIMGIVAEQKGISIGEMSVEVTKEMHSNPRRVGQITLVVKMPRELPERERKLFEHAALACPVHKSISPEVKVEISFDYVL